MSSPSPWVGSVEELVAFIRPGARLAVGGVHSTRIPVAALRALTASRTGDLHYIAWGGGLALEILLAHELVGTAEICFSNADVFGLAPRFRRAAETGSLKLVEHTALQLLTGLRAAAENLEWSTMQAPAGSVFDDPALRLGTTPPGQRVQAIPLDAMLLHAQRADDSGNVEIAGARATDVQTLFAAGKVLVTVEERVPRGSLGERGAFVVPRDRVTAVALAPGGAHPTSCLPFYTADLEAFGRAILSPDAAAQAEHLEPPPPTRRVAQPRIGHAITRAIRSHTGGGGATPASWSIDELMVCWLARSVADDSICTCGSAAPLPVAAYMLAKRTHAPNALLMSMNGCFLDIDERPLSLGLAELQDYQSAAVHCGGEDSYRWHYQPGRITHEVVGAAQVDAFGATNNLWVDKPSGGRLRLPGQGGMADVANLHRDFLIYLPRHSRMVTTERVAQVSASRAWADAREREAYGYRPGRAAVLSDLCVLEPTGPGGRLEVTSLHPGVEFDDVRDATGFEVSLSRSWTRTQAPSEDELRVLREEVDPLGVRRLDFLPAKQRQPLLAEILAAERAVLESVLSNRTDNPMETQP